MCLYLFCFRKILSNTPKLKVMSVRLACNKFHRITSNLLFKRSIYRQYVSHKEQIKTISTSTNCHSKIENKFAQKTQNIAVENDKNPEENLLFLKNDPDTFGPPQKPFQEDPGDIEEEEYIQNPPMASQKLDLKQYAKMIKDNLDKNHIKEAIDVLETRMLKEDRVKPGKYIYKILISGCAKAGYSKKAFELYNKMKQRGLQVTPSIYTSLFNACANAPWAQDGLNKANRLREIMLEKGYEPNEYNYNAMIKAYGRCGDIKQAYQLADEMMEKNLKVNTETFNFLLQACASDYEYGFRHALLTWHKMLRRNIQPDLYSFNTMIRCIRDCSIGDLETMEAILLQILSKNKQIEMKSQASKNISSNNEFNHETVSQSKPEDDISLSNELSSSSNDLPESILNTSTVPSSSTNIVLHQTEIVDETPNLLCNNPHLGSLISISEIKEPQDRLLLLGGFSGFLEEMKKAKVTPGIETFTALLEVIPPTIAAEKKLISMIRKIGLKVDIDFFNILIKKRSMRFDYAGAREVLNMIKTAKLHPDIITYGVLALSCQTQDEARELLNEMHDKGIRMNIQILGAMLRQGCATKNLKYINEILQITLDEQIKPNVEFLKHLDTFKKGCQKMIYQNHPLTKQKSFKKDFDKFKEKLSTWEEEWNLKDLKLEDAIKKIRENPLLQFKESQIKGIENTKNEKLLRKQKNRRYIKKIKIKDEINE